MGPKPTVWMHAVESGSQDSSPAYRSIAAAATLPLPQVGGNGRRVRNNDGGALGLGTVFKLSQARKRTASHVRVL